MGEGLPTNSSHLLGTTSNSNIYEKEGGGGEVLSGERNGKIDTSRSGNSAIIRRHTRDQRRKKTFGKQVRVLETR